MAHPHCVYILIPAGKTKRYYVGYTNDPKHRLAVHNAGKVRSTAGWRPYRMLIVERFPTKGSALAYEKYLKLHPVHKKILIARHASIKSEIVAI